ncbi:LacI family DNA-binding transcriptional regulator [Ktedonobacter racemifer]|uniref:Transcriptional regulator, LacI family n=1 Tax=Ktedonobacter racemifer DSM 44963 TaxID=485913 RepID=D6TV67_KTERA|nr:LacI family DNA-binding transcriptional regulator [Ktedonobacter racemifer]EFH84167.1 transcriptional regulator, LacI family [Ktedonobacter racemifer DSM 44963]
MKIRAFSQSLPLQRVNQRDIAERAGVSISTVSRVLNNVSGISPELRQHVMGIATELGYYDSASTARLEHIGLFTTTFNPGSNLDTFNTNILHGVEGECRQHDIQLSYSIFEENKAGTAFMLKKIRERQVEGALLISVNEREIVEQLLNLNIPTALINVDQSDLPVDTFLPDNFGGGLQATRHLIAQGHRHILHITKPATVNRRTLYRRNEGYRSALQEADIPFDPRLVLECPLGVEEVQSALRDLLMSGEPLFTAIFCVNDASAIGAMRALQEAGLRVPEDVSVIGFDDIPTASLLTPALTTMRVDCKEMGLLATRRLVDRYHRPEATPTRVEIATQLISRQSVGPAPTAKRR